MNFIILTVIALAFSLVAARSIRSIPWLWYGIAIAIDILYFYGVVYSLPPSILQPLSFVVQRGLFATALFVVIMYCGVFPENSFVRKTIGPIRAELSIIASIFAFAHCYNYLTSYIGVLTQHIDVINSNQLASLIIAIILLIMLVVLCVTSIKQIKKAMSKGLWKNIQRTAYVFFALIYIHELLILYPSALKGIGDARSMLIIEGVVFGAYFVARSIRYVLDKKAKAGSLD